MSSKFLECNYDEKHSFHLILVEARDGRHCYDIRLRQAQNQNVVGRVLSLASLPSFQGCPVLSKSEQAGPCKLPAACLQGCC